MSRTPVSRREGGLADTSPFKWLTHDNSPCSPFFLQSSESTVGVTNDKTWWLTAKGKSSSKRYSVCFWCLWASNTHTQFTYIHTQSTYIHAGQMLIVIKENEQIQNKCKNKEKGQSRMNASYILLTSYSVYQVVSGSHRTIREQNEMAATATTQTSALRNVVICNVVTMVMWWWHIHSTRMLRPRREEQFISGR